MKKIDTGISANPLMYYQSPESKLSFKKHFASTQEIIGPIS